MSSRNLAALWPRIRDARHVVWLFLGPAAGLVVALAPIPGLSRDAHTLAGILALVIVYWVTEALPLAATALLGVALAILLGIADATKAFSALGNEVIFLFIGSFMLAKAMAVHGLDRRMAFTFLSIPFVEKSPLGLMLFIALAAAGISMWVSNTATTAMLLPVVMTVGQQIGGASQGRGTSKASPYTVPLLFMLAYAASIGGLATPVGTPPNLIGIALIKELTGRDIHFVQWVQIALPMSVLMLLVAFGILAAIYRPPLYLRPRQQGYFRKQLAELGPMTAGQRNVLLAFLVAVTLWVLPGAVAIVAGQESPLYATLSERLPEGVVAVIAAVLLFILPTDWRRRRFTLTWEEGVSIDWGIVILFAGGIALGGMMLDTGLANALGTALVENTGLTSTQGITAASVTAASLISEAASNTASASIIIPVMTSLAESAGVATLIPALGATMGASFGFMLPVSTPPNALIYGSGRVTILQMVRNGILLDVLGCVALWAYLSYGVPLWLE